MTLVSTKFVGLATAFILLSHTTAHAAPAPFYLWQSSISGKFICKQLSPGEGWSKFSGPFEDGGCRKALPPRHDAAIKLV